MVTTTDVVQRKSPFRDIYRRHGYFFREAAILTILMGFGLHLYRVIFGDELTLQYVVTPTTDMLLMIPMTSRRSPASWATGGWCSSIACTG